MASVALFAYVSYHIFVSLGVTVSTLVTKTDSAEQKISLQAYVVRDESLLYADSGSNVNYLVNDGERVAKGYRLAAVYEGQDVRSEITALDDKISVLRKSDLGQNIVMADTASIDAKLSASVLQIRKNLLNGNIDYVLRQRSDLQVLLNKRQVVTNRLDGLADKIKALEDEKNRLLSGEGQQISYITAPTSGYFYHDVDGYEEVFRGTEISSMTLNGFRSLIQADPQDPNTEKTVVGKLVTSFSWYLACPVDADEIGAISVGQRYEVAFPYNNGNRITMNLERIITEPDSDDCVLILSSNYATSDMNYLRTQAVELIVRSYTGYRVPVASVRMVDGVQGVYVLTGSLVEYRRIVPLYEADGYFICEPKDPRDESQYDRLNLHDLIINKGRDLYAGKIIG